MNNFREVETVHGLVSYNKNIGNERKGKIIWYIENYFLHIIKQFPELKGKNIYLLLQKQGWFARYDPFLSIVICENSLALSEYRIRFTTAHDFFI